MKRDSEGKNKSSKSGFFGLFSTLIAHIFPQKEVTWKKFRRAEYPEIPTGDLISYDQVKFHSQSNEIDHFKRHKEDILKIVKNPAELQACFEALEVLNLEFDCQKRETGLNNLNTAIIRSYIEDSKEQGGRELLCENAYITRLPASLFVEEPAFWTKLESLKLSKNSIIELPDEVSQLSSLKRLNLLENPITVLPQTLKALTSLEEAILPCDVVDYYGGNIQQDYLPSCPVKILHKFEGQSGIRFRSKELEEAPVFKLQRKQR